MIMDQSNKTIRKRCIAVTFTGEQCRRTSKSDGPFCSMHLKNSPYISFRRQRLSRKEIVQLAETNGGTNGLDFTYTDLSDLKLGSSVEKTLPFDGVIFGKYGDILSGVVAERTIFVRNSFREAKFIGANLREANFFLANLTNADLRFSDLTNARLGYANLSGANLFGTRLIDANMRDVNLHGADLFRAVLSGRTELTRENIGESILQEDENEYREFIKRNILADSKNPLEHHLNDRFYKAVRIYETLRVHFEANGNTSDANWAYLKERRMKKKWNGALSSELWHQKDWKKSFVLRIRWIGDWFVELLCDYGESVSRVVGWLMALIFFIGPLSLSLSGRFDWNDTNARIYYSLEDGLPRFLYSYFQYLLYTLDTITTANFSVLRPVYDLTRLLSAVMASIGIILLGLLGFVTGNRIRHS